MSKIAKLRKKQKSAIAAFNFIQKEVPERIHRGISHHMHVQSRYWMHERDAAGMQAYATIGVGTWEAVFQVPFDMNPACSELGPYLMVPSCKELDFKQCVAV